MNTDTKLSHSGKPLDICAAPYREGVADGEFSLTDTIERMRHSEINFGLSLFWDSDYLLWIGDELNGYECHGWADSPDDSAAWFEKHAAEVYPDSDFAKHHWQVYSTVVGGEGAILVKCLKTGQRGSVIDHTPEEWSRAFTAPSQPYCWPHSWRVEVATGAHQ